MDKFSERRLKENEVIFREANRGVLDFVEEETESDNTKIDFYCECSMETCRQRIRLSTRAYRKLHQGSRQFIVLPGHESPQIEKVIHKEPGLSVVEKMGPMPSPEDISAALTKAVIN